MKCAQPRTLSAQFISQREGKSVVPVGEIAGDSLIGAAFAVEINRRAAGAVAREHHVREPRGKAARGRAGGRNAVVARTACAQPHVEQILLLPQREVAFGSVARKRDNSRRSILRGVGRMQPRFNRNFARTLHRADEPLG